MLQRYVNFSSFPQFLHTRKISCWPQRMKFDTCTELFKGKILAAIVSWKMSASLMSLPCWFSRRTLACRRVKISRLSVSVCTGCGNVTLLLFTQVKQGRGFRREERDGMMY